jgi:hypothetical protein
MHAGDYWSGIPFIDLFCHIVENGERKSVTVPDCPWHAVFDQTHEKLRVQGLSRDVPLGESEIHVVKCRDAIEAQAEIARNTPEALLPAAWGCECAYCERLKRYCEERRTGETRRK